MFEHLDDVEGTPMELARPAEARHRAAKMLVRRRVLSAAVAVAIVVSGVGLATNLADGRQDAEVSAAAPDRRDREEEAPDVMDVPAPTIVDPAPDGAAVERRLEADLGQEFESTATGVVSAELVGDSTWKLTVEAEGIVPNLVHNVLVQHRTEDGTFALAAFVCEGTSDADGSFSCSAWLEFDGSTAPALLSLMGYDPESTGYRLIGYGELKAD